MLKFTLVKMLISLSRACKHTSFYKVSRALKLWANSQTDSVINPVFPCIVVCWWQTPNQLFHKILSDKMWQTIVVLCLHITLILFLSPSASPSLHPHSLTAGKGLSTDRGERPLRHTQLRSALWLRPAWLSCVATFYMCVYVCVSVLMWGWPGCYWNLAVGLCVCVCVAAEDGLGST